MLSVNLNKKAKILLLLGVAVASILSLWYGEGATASSRRNLSINLGGGDCRYTGAIRHTDEDFPTDQTFSKTIIAGYPSGDKRLTFIQLEALTGLPARDEWDFHFLGMTNSPFIKANYPHHEGIWGWGDIGDQVVMVVSDIKRVLIEYHDIVWGIGYAQNFDEAYERIENLYVEPKILYNEAQDGEEAGNDNAPVADFLVWRDLRVFDEIHWYSWFIDYYMEAGLMRDMFTHQVTVPSQWEMAMLPNFFTKHEMRQGRFVDEDEVITPSYDPMCATLTKGCYPVLVVDPENLSDPIYGPAESRKLAEVVNGTEGFEDWMIDEEAWECVWSELIIEKKGAKTYLDKNIDIDSYTYSFELKNEMWHEINRLITKYGRGTDQVTIDLIKILTGHRDALGVDTPVDPLSYEDLMSYHLAFPPFFPNQKPFSSDDDFFLRTHAKWEDPEAASVESIIDRRRVWFEEQMEEKRKTRISIKYYDATGWTHLPPAGLDSLTPYAEDTTGSIRYKRTLGAFATSGRNDNVAALFQGYMRVYKTVTRICMTSDDGSKLFIDDTLLINHDGLHGSSKLCAGISSGMHKVDLEYFEGTGGAEIFLEWGDASGERNVPPTAWTSSGGMKRRRDLIRLNDLLEEDLRNLKETDIMGPWTRAEFNKRKEAAADPSVRQQQQSKKYNFSTLDQMLSEKMKTVRENGE